MAKVEQDLTWDIELLPNQSEGFDVLLVATDTHIGEVYPFTDAGGDGHEAYDSVGSLIGYYDEEVDAVDAVLQAWLNS